MKECSKWKSGKRFLTAAITLSLLGSLGLYSPAAYAEEDFEEYTGSITGKEDNASEYVMAHITKDGGKNYKFTDGFSYKNESRRQSGRFGLSCKY